MRLKKIRHLRHATLYSLESIDKISMEGGDQVELYRHGLSLIGTQATVQHPPLTEDGKKAVSPLYFDALCVLIFV
jgi:hypothetical protein